MDIKVLHEEYKALNLNEVIDYQKYKLYSIVASSTAIEGSTLTEAETSLLLDENITASGKPLEHHLMVKDNYEALLFTLKEATLSNTHITPDLLIAMNAHNMRNTGAIVKSALGDVDEKKENIGKLLLFRML